MNTRHRAVLATAIGLVVCGPALALDGTLKKVKESGTITLGHRESSTPFSYYDDKQKVIGYSIDLCMKIVEAVKAELKMPDLKVALAPVTSATRIPLLANGTVDMECGSTTNNLERQKQIAYAPTTFVTATRFVSKKASNLNKLADLKGKSVVSTAGTTNIKYLLKVNGEQNLGINVLTAKDHAEAFLMVETGRAAAFVMDDILLYGLVAGSKAPGDYSVSADAFTVEPYGIMVRKGDPAFKKVADGAIAAVFKSGEIDALYRKWFLSPIPPKGVNLNVPMSAQLKNAIARPTDSGDPAVYK